MLIDGGSMVPQETSAETHVAVVEHESLVRCESPHRAVEAHREGAFAVTPPPCPGSQRPPRQKRLGGGRSEGWVTRRSHHPGFWRYRALNVPRKPAACTGGGGAPATQWKSPTTAVSE